MITWNSSGFNTNKYTRLECNMIVSNACQFSSINDNTSKIDTNGCNGYDSVIIIYNGCIFNVLT